MTVRRCYLCQGVEFRRVPGEVRDRPELGVLECASCGLVFLESFDHIHKSYYEGSGMHPDGEALPVEQWLRESAADDRRRCDYLREASAGRDLLDFGAGAGGFARMMREYASSVAVVEPEQRLTTHFEKLGIVRYPDMERLPADQKFDFITLFHVLEHLPDPGQVLQHLATRLKPGGRIILEVPSADDALLKLYASEPFSRFTYWSCHLYLFTNATLARLIASAGLKVNFIKQIQRYGVANHMHWLARGRPGGHHVWTFLDSPELHAAYERQLAALGLCDTILAEIAA